MKDILAVYFYKYLPCYYFIIALSQLSIALLHSKLNYKS